MASKTVRRFLGVVLTLNILVLVAVGFEQFSISRLPLDQQPPTIPHPLDIKMVGLITIFVTILVAAAFKYGGGKSTINDIVLANIGGVFCTASLFFAYPKIIEVTPQNIFYLISLLVIWHSFSVLGTYNITIIIPRDVGEIAYRARVGVVLPSAAVIMLLYTALLVMIIGVTNSIFVDKDILTAIKLSLSDLKNIITEEKVIIFIIILPSFFFAIRNIHLMKGKVILFTLTSSFSVIIVILLLNYLWPTLNIGSGIYLTKWNLWVLVIWGTLTSGFIANFLLELFMVNVIEAAEEIRPMSGERHRAPTPEE